MGNNTRIEDVTLKLGSTGHYNLTGINFGGNNTTQSSKVRTTVLTVDNSTAGYTGTSNIYGVLCNGTGPGLTNSSFSFNSVKGSTINVYSDGDGNKRGFLVSNSNQVSTRDTNIYVAQPTNPGSTGATASVGSYIGIETNDAGNVGSIQIRSTTVGCVYPLASQSYTASDIKQTTPQTITDPTYLASPGIQIGPGTDLVTKSAGNKGFSTYIYPTTIYYGLKGQLSSATNSQPAWCWPGTQAISNGTFPDSTSSPVPAFYRVQQPTLVSGLSVTMATSAGFDQQSNPLFVQVSIYYIPAGGSYPTNYTATPFTITLSGNSSSGNFYNGSTRLTTGDLIHLELQYSTSGNNASDISIQVDLF
jgi:hypothetical protein